MSTPDTTDSRIAPSRNRMYCCQMRPS